MKKNILFMILFIGVFVLATYKIRDDLNVTGDIVSDSNITADTFFGVFDGIDTLIDTVTYADTSFYAFDYLNDSAYADTAGYALTYKNDSAYADTAGYALTYKNDSAYADTSGRAIQANNADSLGHQVSTYYLNNVFDTTGTIYVDSSLNIGTATNYVYFNSNGWLRGISNSSIRMRMSPVLLAFYDSTGSEDNSDTTLSITNKNILISNQDDNVSVGIEYNVMGQSNIEQDSLYYIITHPEGLNFYRYTDQLIYSTFGLNMLHMIDTTAGSVNNIVLFTEDSIWLYKSFGYNPYNHNWSFEDSLVFHDGSIDMNQGNIYDVENVSVNNKLTATDSFVTNTGTIDTITNLKLTSDNGSIDTITNLKLTSGHSTVGHSTIDTAIIDTAKIRGLYVTQGAEIDSGLEINGTDAAGLVVQHGNSYLFDDVTLEYKAPYYQSYFGIHDPRDSNAWLMTANDLRLYKQGITGSVFTDSLWLRLDSLGFKVVKYGTTDTTARVQDGFVSATDSVKTSKFSGATLALSGGLSAIATAESLYWNSATGDGIVTGDWNVRDTLKVHDIQLADGYITGLNKITSDTVVVGDNAMLDDGTFIKSPYLYASTYIQASSYRNVASNPINILFNNGANNIIRWSLINSDNANDTSMVEDSLKNIRIKRKTTMQNMFTLCEGRFKDDTVFILTDTFTVFTNGMQFIDTTGDDSLYTRVRGTWIKQ